MNNKATKINEKGFYIWFDKNNKKEYYATPITLYRAKIVKNKDSKFSHIVFSENYLQKVTPKRNKPAVVKNALKLKSLDIHNPYEERIGMFLINFLNAETENWKVAYKSFFYAYNVSLLQNYSIKKQIKSEYEDETDFRRTAEEIYEASKEDIINLQKEFKKCVNYMYNLNGNEDDKQFDPYTKLQAYALSNNMNKYTNETDVIFDSLSIFKDSFVSFKLNNIAQNNINNKINLQDGVKYSSTYLSNICFLVLNEIANNKIPIKACKSCGRYFIPVNRNAEVYCDLMPVINGKKCRELGARTTYAKNIKDVEALLIYRRTYQKRLMELARNPDTTEDERNDFNKWKKEAQAQIKLYKKEKITEDELYKWMIENK